MRNEEERTENRLILSAAAGAASNEAEIVKFDLSNLEPYTGCISCFGCKQKGHEGECICRDGLAPVLKELRTADGLIIGSPIYLNHLSAGFHALFERLAFQNITYCPEDMLYQCPRLKVLLIVTSNMEAEGYGLRGYDKILDEYKRGLESFVGPSELFISGDTLQVPDYSKYHWTMFDPEAKERRHETVFPKELEQAFRIGADLL